DEVVHVALGLGELHLVHALARVPVEEGLAPEHGRELLRDTLEELLDGRAVADEGDGHLEAPRRDVTHGRLHVVGDPLDEVRAVLVLHVEHLLVHLLHGHATSEDGGHREVTAVTGIAGGHHVFGVEDLLGELGDGEGAVLLAAAGRQGGEAGHEEVEAREGHHVDGQLAEIGVELTGETQAGGDAAHGGRDEVVEVT
ncbi:hypothetical protein FQV17_0009575, partial [Megadyptes antipodes antipodes]